MKEELTTVYLILPARRLGTHSTRLCLMIASVVRPLMIDTRKPKVPALFMLDEFAQLGHLPGGVIFQNQRFKLLVSRRVLRLLRAEMTKLLISIGWRKLNRN